MLDMIATVNREPLQLSRVDQQITLVEAATWIAWGKVLTSTELRSLWPNWTEEHSRLEISFRQEIRESILTGQSAQKDWTFAGEFSANMFATELPKLKDILGPNGRKMLALSETEVRLGPIIGSAADKLFKYAARDDLQIYGANSLAGTGFQRLPCAYFDLPICVDWDQNSIGPDLVRLSLEESNRYYEVRRQQDDGEMFEKFSVRVSVSDLLALFVNESDAPTQNVRELENTNKKPGRRPGDGMIDDSVPVAEAIELLRNKEARSPHEATQIFISRNPDIRKKYIHITEDSLVRRIRDKVTKEWRRLNTSNYTSN